MQEERNHDRNAPTGGDREPCPGPVSLDQRRLNETGPPAVRFFVAAEQSSRLVEDEEIEALAHEG